MGSSRLETPCPANSISVFPTLFPRNLRKEDFVASLESHNACLHMKDSKKSCSKETCLTFFFNLRILHTYLYMENPIPPFPYPALKLLCG